MMIKKVRVKMLQNFLSKTIVLLMILHFSCSPLNKPIIDGELKKWHRITISFEGPQASELDDFNPFLKNIDI